MLRDLRAIWEALMPRRKTQHMLVMRLLLAVIEKLDRLQERMEYQMSELRNDFNEDLTELGTAIGELADRIDALPDQVDELTQEDLDAIKSVTSRVNGLAVAAESVPTPEQPAEPQTPVEPQV